MSAAMVLPDEVAKSKNQDTNTSKLHSTSEIGIEVVDVCRKHGGESQWSETLCEGHHCGRSDACDLPHVAPVQWVIGVVTGLRDKHLAMGAFDKVMRPNISHDLRPREDLGVQLLLDLPTLLEEVSDEASTNNWATHIFGEVFCLHDEVSNNEHAILAKLSSADHRGAGSTYARDNTARSKGVMFKLTSLRRVRSACLR